MLRLTRLLLVSLPLLAGPAVAQELPVDLELVLAVDVSGSIDMEEARQQREGYVAALADPAVVQAIRAGFHRRIALAYLEWASGDYQRLVLDWTLIEDDASAQAFAGRLALEPARTARWTSISAAIDAAVPLFDANGYAGDRRVIDVSGDGPEQSRPLGHGRARCCRGAGHRHQRPADPQRPAAAVRPADADGAGPGHVLL